MTARALTNKTKIEQGVGIMHLFKLNDGIYIDDKKIHGVTGVEIKSHVGDISEVTLTFLCTVDGLDNIKDNPVAASIQK